MPDFFYDNLIRQRKGVYWSNFLVYLSLGSFYGINTVALARWPVKD